MMNIYATALRKIARRILKTSVLLFIAGVPFDRTISAQQWTQLDDVPGISTDGMFSFTIDDKIYLGGGTGSKKLYVFDTQSNSWSDLGNIPGVVIDRWFGVGFAMNGKGYMGLGYDNGGLTNDFWEYDATTNSWTQLADHPTMGRAGAIGFSAENMAYVGGGIDDALIYPDLYSYDRSTDTWSLAESLPMGPIVFGNVMRIADRIFVIGGDQGTSESSQLFEFVATDMSWQERAGFIGAPRQAAVTFSIGDIGYYGSGHTQYQTGFSDIYAYDATMDQWSAMGDMPGGDRGWAIGAGVNGKGYFGTGFNFVDGFYSDWWTLEPAVGVHEVLSTENDVIVFPTLVTDRMNVITDERAMVTIHDHSGREVMNGQQVQAGSSLFELESLSSGQYYLTVSFPNRIISRKFIKH